MGIEISSNFDVKTGLPLDGRTIVADTTARDAIPSLQRYEGMVVYSTADAKNYQLQGGITNTDWVDIKSGAISLTTTGTGGNATLIGDVLNIPNYTFDLTNLSANSPLTYNSSTGAFSINTASGSQAGALSSTDWTTFNNKQNAITLTTTGSSGTATLVGSTLNVPQYAPNITPSYKTILIDTTTQAIGDKTLDLTGYSAGDLLHISMRGIATNTTGASRTFVYTIDSASFRPTGATGNGNSVIFYFDAYIPITDGTNAKYVSIWGHQGTANFSNNVIAATDEFTSQNTTTLFSASASTTLTLGISSTNGQISGISADIVMLKVTAIKA